MMNTSNLGSKITLVKKGLTPTVLYVYISPIYMCLQSLVSYLISTFGALFIGWYILGFDVNQMNILKANSQDIYKWRYALYQPSR